MSLEKDIDLLRQVPFFADFNDDQLRLVAFGAETRLYRAKQVLFRQGDLADSAFIIAKGEVRMTLTQDGMDQQFQSLSVGSLIGEMALVAETRRSAMATAVEDVRCIQIRRSVLRRVMDEYPDLAVNIQDRVTNRLGNLVSDLDQVSEMINRSGGEAPSLDDVFGFVQKN